MEKELRRPTDASALPAPKFGDFLGIYTKSQATFKNTGVERLHNFLLQDQACKLLPKHRVCNCLKKRIDKTKDRLVKYNVDRKKHTGRMYNVVAVFGLILFVLNKLQRKTFRAFFCS